MVACAALDRIFDCLLRLENAIICRIDQYVKFSWIYYKNGEGAVKWSKWDRIAVILQRAFSF